jgi:hypothetical protein
MIKQKLKSFFPDLRRNEAASSVIGGNRFGSEGRADLVPVEGLRLKFHVDHHILARLTSLIPEID